MPHVTVDRLLTWTTGAISALGAPPPEAAIVAGSLVSANLAGHDSHGIIRLDQYARMIRQGEFSPGAPTLIVSDSPAALLLDGNWNFGQVVAHRAVDYAIQRARANGAAVVSVRNSHHLGRLGEYLLRAARENMICFAAVNNHGRGNLVAPYGGSDGRLSTNPLAFACPGPDHPILVDITTSVAAEGKIRIKRNAGEKLPEGWILDRFGNPSTDPADLYTDPRGAILPFGGSVGHKGYALAVMVDILAGALSGAGCSHSSTCRLGNAMFFLVVDPERFAGGEAFAAHVRVLRDHLLASPPAAGFDRVMLPGEIEFREEERRRREGIEVDEATWSQYVSWLDELGVPWNND